ncbi:MAG: hypothetical protein FWG15_05140 [Propionibacteriaceae bacterium]|jgi:hypothetical protein|nr:hypothetical protein [Propionibacteriaceae bacterium]
MNWIVKEAFHNVRTTTTKPGLLVSTFVALVFMATLSDLLTIAKLMTDALHYRNSGASTFIVNSPGQIRGDVCDQLADQDGVESAGALKQQVESLTSQTLPRGPIASYQVTEGALRLFEVEDSGHAGLVLSTEVANTLGVTTGGSLPLTQGGTYVRGVFEWADDGRKPGFSYSALTPVPADDLFDECWIKTWPMATNAQQLLRLTVDPRANDLQVRTDYSQMNTRLGSEFTGFDRYLDRITRFAPILALIVAGFLGFIFVWLRRLELASAQHVGASKLSQVGQLLIEHGFCLVVGGAIVLGLDGLTMALITPADPGALWQVSFRVLMGGIFGGLLGTTLGVNQISSNHLFRYFKTR